MRCRPNDSVITHVVWMVRVSFWCDCSLGTLTDAPTPMPSVRSRLSGWATAPAPTKTTTRKRQPQRIEALAHCAALLSKAIRFARTPRPGGKTRAATHRTSITRLPRLSGAAIGSSV
eukprot:5236550-Prymnesium_polylepis.2